MRRLRTLFLPLPLLLLLLAACTATSPPPPPGAVQFPPPAPVDLDRPLSPAERAWVDSTLASLDLREKAAQLVFVRVTGIYRHRESVEWLETLELVRELGVGGVVAFRSEVETLPRMLRELQAAAAVPLLVSMDVERGLAFRVAEGTVPLPTAMAVGATGDPEWARWTGEVTAREARALGVHWALAPVADVNNDPANPVINVRSYGEDPARVAEMVAAFVRGARAGGLLTTAKHFPGHGDTGVDSHLERPVLEVDRARLEAVEWPPFEAAIAAGTDAVMLAHVAVPALDPSGAPATLSPALSGRLLRDEMGFDGLIVTDAIEMAGVRPAWTGEAVVRAVEAGADVLLLPDDPRVAVASLARAVTEGLLPESRLDRSVRRLLEAKARAGLAARPPPASAPAADPLAAVGRPEDVAHAAEAAAAAVTLVRDGGPGGEPLLPLRTDRPGAPLDLLHLVLASDFDPHQTGSVPAEELARRAPTRTVRLGPGVRRDTADEIVEGAADHGLVVASIYARVSSGKGTVDMDPSQAELLRRLATEEGAPPVVAISYDSPYVLGQVPEVPVYLVTYGATEPAQRAAVAALFGEAAIGGRLPVGLPGLHPAGHGLDRAPLPAGAAALPRIAPEAAGFRPEGLAEVGRIVERAIDDGAFPGAVVAVGRGDGLAYLEAFGHQSWDRRVPVGVDTIYDLASLTKVVVTTTMAMILVDEGRLDLDKPVADYLPRFRGPDKERVTVRHLLVHASGLEWWSPLYEEVRGPEAYLERILPLPLAYEPGSRTEYSDIGLVVLGAVLERVAGVPLDVFARERIFAPLDMDDTYFVPPPELLPRIAPTEVDPWRGRLVHGEVHDENAHAMGGVAPHAGLFSTAPDLARFTRAIAAGGALGTRRIVSRATVERFTRRAGDVPGSTRALGWDTKSEEGYSTAGSLFSPGSYGHTGFTGTSIWVDPDRDLFLVLLTNRVHPTRDNQKIREVRPAVADAVIRALVDPGPSNATDGSVPLPPVTPGLDRLAAGEDHGLAGRRVGLLAHAASVTRDGRHAIDVVAGTGARLVRLFAPEHGLRSRAAAGEAIGDGEDPATGLPIVSLYGEKRAPAAADLADLDALVVDLQDAGVRFYTYASTMLLALDAAAEAGVELVVLDRPNPLGGERIEGPVSAPRNVVPASLVNRTPGPLVHGLTLGELARHENARRERPAKLTVIPMAGWRRSMTWEGTGLPWVAPSPNLRTPEAALAYPGTALLEATNLSEGRGTDAPFLTLGAPWLEPAAESALATHAARAGFTLSPATFTPTSSPAAPHPKHAGDRCRGWTLTVQAPAAARPYELGVTLLAHLRDHPSIELLDDGHHLTRLVGTPRLLEALRAGRSAEEILAADREDHERWRRERVGALLYPE